MNSKIVSFQIVQGFGWGTQNTARSWTPDVIALCADGSLWCLDLDEFQKGGSPNWMRMTPETVSNHSFMGNHV
jgi:hypothetical protein